MEDLVQWGGFPQNDVNVLATYSNQKLKELNENMFKSKLPEAPAKLFSELDLKA